RRARLAAPSRPVHSTQFDRPHDAGCHEAPDPSGITTFLRPTSPDCPACLLAMTYAATFSGSRRRPTGQLGGRPGYSRRQPGLSRVHGGDGERPERCRADLEVTRRRGGAGSIPARRVRQTKTAAPPRDGRPDETL